MKPVKKRTPEIQLIPNVSKLGGPGSKLPSGIFYTEVVFVDGKYKDVVGTFIELKDDEEWEEETPEEEE